MTSRPCPVTCRLRGAFSLPPSCFVRVRASCMRSRAAPCRPEPERRGDEGVSSPLRAVQPDDRRGARVSRAAAAGSSTLPRTRRCSRRRADPSPICISSSADSSAAAPTTRRRIRTARSDPASCFRWARCRPGAARPGVFFAIKDTYCYLLPRADFLELRQTSPEFERYCTQAITETLKQSLESLHGQYQPARRRAAVADPDAGRTRSQPARSPAPPRPRCARRRRRWRTPRCARSSRSTRDGAPDRHVHAGRPAGARRAARPVARRAARRRRCRPRSSRCRPRPPPTKRCT